MDRGDRPCRRHGVDRSGPRAGSGGSSAGAACSPEGSAPRNRSSGGSVGARGRPIARVAVVLDGNVWTDARVPAVTSVKPGEPLTASSARRALAELLATGRFALARVTATAEGPGAVLVLRVVPRKLVKRLELDLHGATVDREELLREAELTVGGELIGTDVDTVVARIARYFAAHGYPSAKVDLQTREMDDPSLTLVIVDVVPGRPRLVDDREYYVFGATRDRVLPLTSAYSVKPGDHADEAAMTTADGALEGALRAHGYFRARVSHDLVWVGDKGANVASSGRIVLRVRMDTGSLVVPRFEGNEHYDATALEGALALETDNDRSSSHLADKVRGFYEKRGFLDAEVRVETRGKDTDPVELLVFHVDEHRRARVVARRYPCLKTEVIKRLSAGGPRSSQEIGTEIDSYLEEELPGADLFVDPDPQGVNLTLGAGAGATTSGTRAEPIDLRPDATYVADTYERATEHVQELYRNEGFLHATVGPVEVVRARCDPRSPPGRCIPLALPPLSQECTYDAAGLPLANAAARRVVHVPPRRGARSGVFIEHAARDSGEARPEDDALGPGFHGIEDAERARGGRGRPGAARRPGEHAASGRRASPRGRLLQGARLRVRRRQVRTGAVAR